ncbi:hypothetical protein NEOLI_001878 [Neolecta irregularis DAH-3]|uniref:Uncharacterized protein n=1 Tax=Neolecta irregularis (strain DAH-3) TaxID=1198029 RepID=A0A1U7LPH5_NEOID|nr:hypothetical protein NEOLI_001878 [Neolecta irregularis DAH-3]|eukprot:OLL24528.1 hypothetical protein NEOLI_001878 [Neolecta irregularis DAH-3]
MQKKFALLAFYSLCRSVPVIISDELYGSDFSPFSDDDGYDSNFDTILNTKVVWNAKSLGELATRYQNKLDNAVIQSHTADTKTQSGTDQDILVGDLDTSESKAPVRTAGSKRIPVKDDYFATGNPNVEAGFASGKQGAGLRKFEIEENYIPIIDPTVDYFSKLSTEELANLDDKLVKEWTELAEDVKDIAAVDKGIYEERIKQLQKIAVERWVIRGIIGGLFSSAKLLAKVNIASLISFQDNQSNTREIWRSIDEIFDGSSRKLASKISQYEGLQSFPENEIRNWCTAKVVDGGSTVGQMACRVWKFMTWQKDESAEE